MKVLLAHNPYGRPSGEEAAVDWCAALLRSHGHEVETILGDPLPPEAGVRASVVALVAGLYNPAARRRMALALERFRPDLVQVQNLYPFLSPSILAPCRRRQIPVVMRCPNYRLFCPSAMHLSHGELCERCLGRGREIWCVARNCERNLAKSAGYALRGATARLSGSIVDNVSQFVVLSEFQKRKFRERGIEESRLTVVPNAAPERLARGPAGGGESISFLGRISPEKGIGDFLAAAAALPDLPFEVAGELREPGEPAAAPGNVRFRGYLDGAELDEFLRRTRILVFPSRCWEGFPNVVAEGMAAGKPVVAADLGAVPEIVENGRTGLLYPAGEACDLAAQLRALWGDPRRCAELGTAGRARALSDFGGARIYEKLRTAYDRARVLEAL